jgi:uncharacterized iron-regulated membrane protein
MLSLRPLFLGGEDMKMSTSFVRRWHRRLAIVLGSYLLFQTVTGVITQNNHSLNKFLSPDLYKVAELSGGEIRPGDLVDLISELEPEFTVAHAMFPLQRERGSAVVIMGGRDKTKHDMSYLMTVDPYARKILSERQSLGGWIEWALYLHIGFLFGVAGKIATAILGTSLVLFSSLGVILWWRTRHIGREAKGVVRIHRTAGVTAAVFVLVLAITGTALSMFTWIERSSGTSVFGNNMVTAMRQSHDGHEISAPTYDGNAAYDLAISKLAIETDKELQLTAYSPYGPHAADYWFAFVDKNYFRTDALVDPVDGSVRIFASGVMEGGEGPRALLLPIHTGNILGSVGDALFSIFGLAMSLWLFSGFILWWQRRPGNNTSADAN